MNFDEIMAALGSAQDLETAQGLVSEIGAAQQDLLAGSAAITDDLTKRLDAANKKVTDLQAELYRATIAGRTQPEPTKNEPEYNLDTVWERMKRK